MVQKYGYFLNKTNLDDIYLSIFILNLFVLKNYLYLCTESLHDNRIMRGCKYYFCIRHRVNGQEWRKPLFFYKYP